MQTQAPSTNEESIVDDDVSHMKGHGFTRHKVVDLDPHADVFEFTKIDCSDPCDGTASSALTVAPSDGCDSIGFSTTSMLSYRNEGLASIGLNLESSQEAGLDESLKMEPVKITSIGPSPSSRNADGTVPSSRFGMVMQANDNLPSVGSIDHGTGMCKPCAWFWKPSSCLNGKDCCHCHLCPAGEIKNRKKAKSGTTQGRPGKTEPAYISSQSNELGEDSTQAQLILDSSDIEGAPKNRQKKGPSSGTKLEKVDEVAPNRLSTSTVATDVTTTDGEVLVDSVPPGLPGPIPSAASESVGSATHGTGECRPCAWYWKPGSCSNGKECLHCHLCSDSEIKKRKKAKLQNLRGGSKEPVETTATTEENNQSYRRSSRSPGRKDRGRRGSRTADSSPPPPALHDMLQVLEPSININDENLQANLPSIGSGLHAMGKCKPCAWHWKPGGCTNGKECCHCHMCPPGELKGRRKAKETAMRAGALLPSKTQQRRSSSSTRNSMHVLKLLPLL